jgi:dTDP-4-dehydrorhamnose 3,5-epimerase
MIVVSKLDKPKHLRQVIHKDFRGSLTEIFLKKKIKFNFCKCITVTSKINVIRGLHFQKKFTQHKIIFVLKGIIKDFVVDIRKNSKTFSKIYNFTLTSGDTLIIPKGFAHGYSSLAKENIVIYFLSEDWYPSQESGIIWNDKFLNINWEIRKPMLSKKDKLLKPFFKF